VDEAVVMGDVEHGVGAGGMGAQDVHAELGQVIAGTRPGRRDDDAITVFDSSGTGIQDGAAAAVAYEVARQRGLGMRCSLTWEVGQRCKTAHQEIVMLGLVPSLHAFVSAARAAAT